MKKKLIVIGVILLVAISAIGLLKMRKAALAKASPPAVLPVVVDAVTLLPQQVTLTLPAMGVVSSDISTTLSTKVSGRVVKVSKREGDAVKKGDLLIRIDARDLRAQKESLRLKRQSLDFDIAAKQENLKALRTALENAIATHARTKELLDVKGASIEQYEQEETTIAQLKAQKQSVESGIAMLRSNIQELLQNEKEIDTQTQLHADCRADRRHSQRPDGVDRRSGGAGQAAPENLRDRWTLSRRQPAGFDSRGEHSARAANDSP